MLLSSDTRIGMIKSIGLGMISFSESLSRLSPDILVCLGDRFEIFAAVYAASLLNIPIAHLHGGELTYGAVDDQLRHAITKASSLHFPVTDIYKKRIIQMGENPKTVINVGALAVERIANVKRISLSKMENLINLSLKKGYLLVTIHPPTKNEIDIKNFVTQIFRALEKFKKIPIIMSYANADFGGKIINKLKEDFCRKDPEYRVIKKNLGQDLYINLMKNATAIVGNSSSGLIEAPITNTPVVNIGNRQDGRISPANVISVRASHKEIYGGIIKMMNLDMNSLEKHPFGNGKTSIKILQEIKKFIKAGKVHKEFYDLGVN
jgi:UDP-N-acetylglucosamine 2-epimerase (non-hydrolysing)/GDP/UDP-N,N'-diacetylbacillosamine 2-epimerase (hydrolysing)